MAKGRKLTMSRSERYLGLGSYSYSDGHAASVTDQSELVEDDIWSATAEHDSPPRLPNPFGAWKPRASVHDVWSSVDRAESQSSPIQCGAWSPRVTAAKGGLSLACDDSSSSSPRIVHQTRRNDRGGRGGGGVGNGCGGRKLATSAPLNVPDWSKIYRVNSVESIHESEDEEDSEMVPPHEYLARSQARRSRKSGGGGGASVFEGVGRTLKGRELRRVRDAVWNQTGFYG